MAKEKHAETPQPVTQPEAPVQRGTTRVRYLVNLPQFGKKIGSVVDETPDTLSRLVEGVEYTTNLEPAAKKK